jgi:predicted NAD-dependent protein-ADP-ribosyltransferase YbiA (DUF1768 family)
MDIHSLLPYPSGALSNFSARVFVVDAERCESMEGFIQSLKFEDIGAQRQARSMSGMAAKKFGAARASAWMSEQALWWKGKKMARGSEELSALVDMAFQSMFDQCADFKEALMATEGQELTHEVGSDEQDKTALTKDEFCKRLLALREHGRLAGWAKSRHKT